MIDDIITWVKEGIEGSGWMLASVSYDYDETVQPVASVGAETRLVPMQLREEVRLTFMRAGFHEQITPLNGSMFTNGAGKVFVIESAELEIQTESAEFAMAGGLNIRPHSPTTICRMKGSIVVQ